VTIAPNGEIITGGSQDNFYDRYNIDAESRGAVEVFKPTGFHDRTFGDRGVRIINTPSDAETGNTGVITDVSVKSDGRILAVDDVHFYRYYPASPDDRPAGYDDYFTTPIYLIEPPGRPTTDSMYVDSGQLSLLDGLVDADIDEDGSVTLVSEKPYGAVTRYGPDGRIDEAFFEKGRSYYSNQAVDFIFSNDLVSEVVTASNGQVIINSATDSRAQPPELVRFNADGSVDESFGDHGVSAIPTSSLNMAKTIVAVDGSIWVLGSHRGNFAVTRLWSDNGPAATVRYAQRTSSAPTTQKIFVTYRDNAGVDASTIDRNDIRVYAPDGASHPVSLFNEVERDGAITATYAYTASGGSWDPSDNGLYIVRVKGEQVTDLDGHVMEGRAIGAFVVHIA
jgi:hypothetical protein